MAKTLRRAADQLEARVVAAGLTRYELRSTLTLDDDDEPPLPTSEELDEYARCMQDRQLGRVALMLYQMSYENALKGLVVLRGDPYPKIHHLYTLAEVAGLVVGEREHGHLRYLTVLNQLGRYRVGYVPREALFDDEGDKTVVVYGAVWVRQFQDRRKALDQAIADAWIQNNGPESHAFLDGS